MIKLRLNIYKFPVLAILSKETKAKEAFGNLDNLRPTPKI